MIQPVSTLLPITMYRCESQALELESLLRVGKLCGQSGKWKAGGHLQGSVVSLF